MRTVYVVTLEHAEDEFPVLSVDEGRIVSVLAPDLPDLTRPTSPAETDHDCLYDTPGAGACQVCLTCPAPPVRSSD